MQGYRTYIAAGLVGLFGALSAIDWITVFNDPKAGLSLIGSAVLMAIMRSVTSTPPGVK